MKKVLLALVGLVVLAAIALPLLRKYTKSHSPEAVAQFEQNGLGITVRYSQPSKKGREIFGGLVPFKQVWRTGANEATEITFTRDVRWGTQTVKAGTYTLFTIPDVAEWTALLNSQTGQWGAYTHQPAKDVAQAKAKPETRPEVTEKFTITLVPAENGADLQLTWDKTRVAIPVRLP